MRLPGERRLGHAVCRRIPVPARVRESYPKRGTQRGACGAILVHEAAVDDMGEAGTIQRFVAERAAFARAQRRRVLVRWAVFGALVVPAGLLAFWTAMFVSAPVAILMGLVVLVVGAKFHPEL